MNPAMKEHPVSKNWCLEDIDFGAIDSTLVRDDKPLFFLLSTASFAEIRTSLYVDNLVDRYSDNQETTAWLINHWQQEEIRHGRSLRAYIRAAWPEFDWDRAYHGFYQQCCASRITEKPESSRALEMVVRCVAEAGASARYRCLCDYAKEPVLKHMLTQIKADEVRHFTHFHRLFQIDNAIEKNSGAMVARVLWQKSRETNDNSNYIAFKHAFTCHYPDTTFNGADYIHFREEVNCWARRRYPYRMAVDMLLALLPLTPPFKRLLRLPLTAVARATIFRIPSR